MSEATETPVSVADSAPNYPDSHIPAWCKLPLAAHHDRYGGCWSLLHGFVQQWGESACVRCDHYARAEPVAAPTRGA